MSTITKVIVVNNGVKKDITVADWKAIPLVERLALMNSQNVKFFAGPAELSPREALSAMK